MGWLGFLVAHPRLTFTVMVTGLVSTAALSAVPYVFAGFSGALEGTGEAQSWGAALLGAFALAAVFGWFKERSELRLVLAVRFLAFRAFFEEGLADRRGSGQAGRFATHPAQISQFAFVIDFGISVLRALIIALFVVVSYGVVGWVAFAGTLLCTFVAIKLVHLIGEVYAHYIESESRRVDRLRDVVRTTWKLRRAGLDTAAAEWLQSSRAEQEPILRHRARLQVYNGLLSNLAVPAVITVAALVAVTGHETNMSLVALLVASGLLYSALQEAVTNYRVVRLTFPMLRAWDERRNSPMAEADMSLLDPCRNAPGPVWIRPTGDEAFDAVDRALRTAVTTDDWIVLQEVPEHSAEVLHLWHSQLSPELKRSFETWCSRFDLPPGLFREFSEKRVSGLSRGERARLALAVGLADSQGAIVLSPANLSSMDGKTRLSVVRSVSSYGRTVIILGDDACGVDVHRVIEVTAEGGEIAWTHHDVSVSVAPAIDEVPSGSLGGEDLSGDVESEDSKFSSPRPSFRAFWKTMRLVLGLGGALAISLAVVCSAVLGVLLPLILETVENTPETTGVIALSGLLAGLVCTAVAVNVLQFTVPIKRLSRLHSQVARDLSRVGSPRRAGEVLGRFGEDFTTMQMQVPANLVGALLIGTQLLAVVGALAVANFVVALFVGVLLPLSYVLYRSGERRLVSAVTDQAEARGKFMGLCSAALATEATSIPKGLKEAVQRAYAAREEHLATQSGRLISAMMRRRTQLQLAGFVIFAGGVFAALWIGPGAVIAPTVIAYFVYTVAGQLPQLIESIQSMSVSIATAGRVTAIPEAPEAVEDSAPTDDELLARLEAEIGHAQSGVILVQGVTGVGKSVHLRQLVDGRVDAVMFEEDFPIHAVSIGEVAERAEIVDFGVGPEVSVGELPLAIRQQLVVAEAVRSDARVVVLDESLSAVGDAMGKTVDRLRSDALATGKTYVVVSHLDIELAADESKVSVGKHV